MRTSWIMLAALAVGACGGKDTPESQEPSDDVLGEGGIDDLVAGAARDRIPVPVHGEDPRT